GGRTAPARTERRLTPISLAPPYEVSERARDVHAAATVVDLHADPLLWGRDLLQRRQRGHVDLPRLIEGNVAVTVFGVATKSPRHLNIERNDDRSDDITLLAIGRGWPAKTWRSLNARGLHPGPQLRSMANRSDGTLTLVRS